MAILSGILSGLGAAAGVAGNIIQAVNNRKQRKLDKEQNARDIAFYESKANENPLASAATRKLIAENNRQNQKQIANARGVAAITGATPEYTLAVQNSIAQNNANVMGGIVAANEARQERNEERAHEARQDAIKAKKEAIAANNAAWANVMSNAAKAATSAIAGMTARQAVTSTKAGTGAAVTGSNGAITEPTYEGTSVGGNNSGTYDPNWEKNLSDEELYT